MPLGRDAGEVGGAEETAESVVEGEQQRGADEDPRLRVGIPVGRNAAGRPRLPHRPRDIRVHLLELGPQKLSDRRLLARLRQRLDPERDRFDPAGGVKLARAVADRPDEVAVRTRGALRVQRVPEARPGVREAGQVELELRSEVPVENRLGDAGCGSDLGRRRAAVAARFEDPQRCVDDRLPALRRRQARPLRAQAATSAETGASSASCRTRAKATPAPARAMKAATSSARS